MDMNEQAAEQSCRELGKAGPAGVQQEKTLCSDPETPAAQNTAEHGSRDNMQPEAAVRETKTVEDVLPTQEPVSVFCDGLTGFGITQQGQSHIRDGNIPCQDSMELRLLHARPIILTAVADGVGECTHSHYGSRTAVRVALDVLQTRLEALAEKKDFEFRNHKQMQGLMVEAFRAALNAVDELAVQMELLPFSFQSTLTVSVYDGSQLYIGHAGDDGVVALTTDGICRMFTRRHKGEASNSVYPLQARNMDFVAVEQEIAAFALMTDGVLDAVVGNEVFENRVYYPFFKQLFEPILMDEKGVQELCRSMNDMLAGQEYRRRVSDDISLVVVTNQSLLARSVKPNFDAEAWIRQTEEITKKIEKQLYTPDPPKKAPKKANAPRKSSREPVSYTTAQPTKKPQHQSNRINRPAPQKSARQNPKRVEPDPTRPVDNDKGVDDRRYIPWIDIEIPSQVKRFERRSSSDEVWWDAVQDFAQDLAQFFDGKFRK